MQKIKKFAVTCTERFIPSRVEGSRSSKSKGFTLIELLVVIAIIGILATIVLVSLNDARTGARDAQRIANIRQAQVALELYFDNNSSYFNANAACNNGVGLPVGAEDMFIGVGMAGVVDPLNNATYYYRYQSSAASASTDYVLGAALEDLSHSALNSDLDGNQITGANTCPCADPVYCVSP